MCSVTGKYFAAGKLAIWLFTATFAVCQFGRPAMSAPLNLQTEQKSDFFSFFHLIPDGSPVAIAGAQSWQSFRPSGPSFHNLVEVDILTDKDGTIREARIGLDRSFINDPRNGVFARDIAKSFLTWSVRDPSPQTVSLIANLADLSGAGSTVIVRDSAAPPPPDATGLYGVYLGPAPHATFTDGGVTLAFTNFPGVLASASMIEDKPISPGTAGGPGWLRIDAQF
jgi:hypothetical protein